MDSPHIDIGRGNNAALSEVNNNMVESPEKETRASPLSVSVSESERSEINRLAAEYGAKVGRPVTVAEYVRLCALHGVAA